MSVASCMLARLDPQEDEESSWGGSCSKIDITEIHTELGGTDNKDWWEYCLADKKVTGGRYLAFSDGGQLGDGRVGGGWYGKGQVGSTPEGAKRVGDMQATVWDGEISGMLGAMEIGKRIPFLADSKAAISAVKKAGEGGRRGQGIWYGFWKK